LKKRLEFILLATNIQRERLPENPEK